MSILYANGFETESLDGLVSSTAAGIATSDTRGPWSAACLAYVGPGLGTGMAVASWATAPSEIYMGFGAKPSFTTESDLMIDNAAGDRQIQLRLSTGGFFSCYLGGLALIATGSVPISLEHWHYFEVHLRVADAGGLVEVRVDGTTVLSFTGDTHASGGADASSADWSTGWRRLDDLIVFDTVADATGANNTWPGDLGLYRIVPNDVGDVTMLARGGVDSGQNWSQVDETPPNDDTDYVSGTVVNDYDLYNLTDAIGTYTDIRGLNAWLRAKKAAAGAASVAQVIKSGGVEAQSADMGLSTDWGYERSVFVVDPSDGLKFTVADVSTLQAGPKVRP